MKKASFILLLLAIGILNSCKKNPTTSTGQTGNLNLGVDVQGSFTHDKVQILIDGETVINKWLTTNNLLGVCYLDGQIVTTRNAGSHEIKVNINDVATKAETFSMNNNLYIGVNYNEQTNEIFIVYSDQRFMYD